MDKPNYKHLYEQTKLMLEMYQDEIVPEFRAKIEELETQHRTEYCEAAGYDCVELGRVRSKPKTKGDRIRAMPDEELAWELMTWRCEAVARHHGVESDFPDTQKSILEWLQQQVEKGGVE